MSFLRYGNRLKVIPIIEGDDVVNEHYHCIIDNPHKKNIEEFEQLVKKSWVKTDLRKPKNSADLHKKALVGAVKFKNPYGPLCQLRKFLSSYWLIQLQSSILLPGCPP